MLSPVMTCISRICKVLGSLYNGVKLPGQLLLVPVTDHPHPDDLNVALEVVNRPHEVGLASLKESSSGCRVPMMTHYSVNESSGR